MEEVDGQLDGMGESLSNQCMVASMDLGVVERNRLSTLHLTNQQMRFVILMMRSNFDWEGSYVGAGYAVGAKGSSGGILRLKRDVKVMKALGLIANGMANKVSCTKDWAIRKCREWVEDVGERLEDGSCSRIPLGVDIKLKCLLAIGKWSGWEFTGNPEGGSGRGHKVVINIIGDSRVEAREIIDSKESVDAVVGEFVEETVDA
jgi:hypothetical protein